MISRVLDYTEYFFSWWYFWYSTYKGITFFSSPRVKTIYKI